MKLSFVGGENYAPFEGGGSDLAPWNGLACLKIESFSDGGKSDAGNDVLKVTLYGNEPGLEGKRFVKNQAVSGFDKSGKPNIRGLRDVFYSMGTAAGGEQGEAQGLAFAKQWNGNFDSDELTKQYKDQPVWVELNARAYESQTHEIIWSSDIRNLVSKKKYDDAVVNGRQKRDLPPDAKRFLVEGPQTAGAGQSYGQSQAAGAPAPQAYATARAVPPPPPPAMAPPGYAPPQGYAPPPYAPPGAPSQPAYPPAPAYAPQAPQAYAPPQGYAAPPPMMPAPGAPPLPQAMQQPPPPVGAANGAQQQPALPPSAAEAARRALI